MLSKDIYKYIENPREKAKADLVNTILDKFNESQTPRIIEYVQFHTEMTNNPIGTRVIYMEDKGYTLVHGDGDKGLGVEYLYNEFTKEWISKYYYNIKYDISEDLYKVGFESSKSWQLFFFFILSIIHSISEYSDNSFFALINSI